MDTEALELLIEQLRKANAVLTAQNADLTARLAALEATNAPEEQAAEQQGKGGGQTETPAADAALRLVKEKAQAAKARDDEYINAMRDRGFSVGTADDYRKYRASRG